MADLAYTFTSDDTEYTQTTIAWSEKVTISSGNFTAGNDYAIIANARVGQSAGSGGVSLFEDGSQTTRTTRSFGARAGNGNTGYPYTAMLLHTAPGTPVGVGIGIRTEGGSWTTYLDDLTLLAIDLDSLSAGDYYTQSHTSTTSLTTSWVTMNTLTFTPGNDGDDWLVFCNVNGSVDSAFRQPEARLIVDDTTVIALTITDPSTGSDGLYTYMLTGAINLDNTEHTIKLQMQEVSSANEYESSDILAIRMDAFEDHQFSYSSAVSSGNPVEIQGIAAFTPTSTGDIIIIGGGYCDSDSGASFNGVNMTIDGTVAPANHNNWSCEQSDADEIHAQFRFAEHAGTASTAIDIDVDGYEEDSSGQFEHCYAIAFSVKLAAAGSTFSATSAITVGGATASASGTVVNTYSATAAATTGGATTSASSTFTAPTYSATSAVTTGGTQTSASSTFAPGTKTATAAITTGGTQTTSAGTVTNPNTFSATAAISLDGIDLIGAGEVPAEGATCEITLGGLEVAVVGDVDTPQYDGTAAVTVGGMELAAVADITNPTYSATSAITTAGVTVAVDAMYNTTVHVASAAITTAGSTLSASATFDVTSAVRSATAAVSLGTVLAVAAAEFDEPESGLPGQNPYRPRKPIIVSYQYPRRPSQGDPDRKRKPDEPI